VEWTVGVAGPASGSAVEDSGARIGVGAPAPEAATGGAADQAVDAVKIHERPSATLR
jgi:hypothetical protein